MKSALHKKEDMPFAKEDVSEPPPAASPEEDLSLWQKIRAWLKAALFYRPGVSLQETLEEVIEVHEEQAEKPLPAEEKRILHNVISFADIRVSDIMTPRSDITAVPHDIKLPALKTHVLRYRHTRIPIYRDTFDQMLGFLHVKDLLPMLTGDVGYDLESLMRKLLLVPPSMRIIDLLVKMRKSGTHMAIVVDEYGGTDGLVTLENLFEKLVGDIQDEHDARDEDEAITRISDKLFEVRARIPIRLLEQRLNLKLMTEAQASEFDTLGGLIFFQIGRVPARGETVTHASGVKFEILEADPRRIHKVRIITG